MQEEKPKHLKINKRYLIAGFCGNVLEWYDFTVYGFFASIIGTLFFPNENKTVQLISVFGIFAAGYVMRPLGGAILGHIGDRHGRAKALFFSILLMAVPTTLIGVLPTYKQIGWTAALFLIILRLLQGISVGGEFTGSISFLVEKAPDNKRGFWGSFTTFGAFGGMLLGSSVSSLFSSLLTTAELHDYGWRIPFLLGSILGVAGLWLRKDMGDKNNSLSKTPYTAQEEKMPLAEFLKDHKLAAFKVFLLTWAFTVQVYTFFIFLPSYLHTFLKIPLDQALSSHTIAITILMIMIPPLGILADKWGRKPLLLIALFGVAIFSYPLFLLLGTKTSLNILIAMLIFSFFNAIVQGVMPALMTESFPKKIRYTGLSVSYNIALALFGGTTPLVATWLIKISDGNILMPSFYLIFTSLVAIIVAIRLPETYKKPLE